MCVCAYAYIYVMCAYAWCVCVSMCIWCVCMFVCFVCVGMCVYGCVMGGRQEDILSTQGQTVLREALPTQSWPKIEKRTHHESHHILTPFCLLLFFSVTEGSVTVKYLGKIIPVAAKSCCM